MHHVPTQDLFYSYCGGISVSRVSYGRYGAVFIYHCCIHLLFACRYF